MQQYVENYDFNKHYPRNGYQEINQDVIYRS